MADTEDKAKDAIDDAAHAAKRTTEKAADAAKDAAYEAGKIKKAGEDIKDAGK